MTRDNAIAPAAAPSQAAAWLPEPTRAILELALAPTDLRALPRLPGLERLGPSRPATLVWHDSADGALARQHLALVREGRSWRLERLRPGHGKDWPAATPPPLLDQGSSPAALRPAPPFDAVPIATLQARRRNYRAHGAELEVLHGTVRGSAASRTLCRLRLAGPPFALAEAASALASQLALSVPRASLALEAITAAKGAAAPARHLGSPIIPAELSVSEGLALIVGHLLDVLLHWTDRWRHDSEPESVHQARVATRRLRSALSLYKRAAFCPELESAGAGLRRCASRLGAARDWDVFLEGTGARLASLHEGDPRVTSLLRTAQRRRAEAYAELRAYLASAEFRELEIGLGCAASLRPWEGGAPSGLDRSIKQLASELLDRRLRRVRKDGRGIAALPTPALHELRKDCKRLRYAAEFFSDGFPTRETKAFLKRLAFLQEELGALNDSAVAASLTAQLGRAGRGYAGGIVEGWASAGDAQARKSVRKAWKTFRTAPLFWAG